MMDKNVIYLGMVFLLVLGLIGVGSAAVSNNSFTNGGYTIVKFNITDNVTASTTWVVPTGVTSVRYLVVGGGGGGYYGGGGAGGQVNGTMTVTPGASLNVTIGSGGNGISPAKAGVDSTFNTTVAAGGGGGGSQNSNGGTGASGGGAGYSNTQYTGGASNATGQGFAGGNNNINSPYPCGGGGGAAVKGSNGASSTGGAGGAGVPNDIFNGTTIYYAGGGGGEGQSGITSGAGGIGGGGSSSAGLDDYGGGGGTHLTTGYKGGSGVVILNYTTPASIPVANFNNNVTYTNASGKINFTDTSTNTPTSWAWNFGDGTANATTQNVSHTYSANILNTTVVYNTTLTATNTGGNNTKFAQNNVTVYPLSITWSANQTTHHVPLYVTITPTVTNGTVSDGYYFWTTGATWENTGSGGVYSARFDTAGTYTVTLNATNPMGTSYNWSQKIGYLTATTPTPPVASFHANATSGVAPLDLLFTDDSSNTPTGWNWSWGDMTANTTTQNPVHTYSNAGTFSVVLTATNADGSSTFTRTNYITVTPAPTAPTAQFSGTPLSGECPLAVQYTDLSTGSPTSWSWNFGDGNTSTLQSPSHTYTAAGAWNIVLNSSNAYGYDLETKTGYVTSSVVSPVAAFTGNPTSGVPTLSVTFTDASTHHPTGYQWQFGDGTPNSTSQNPTHSYTAVGTYTVNLTVTNAAGSSSFQRVGYISLTSSAYPNRVAASQTVAAVDISGYTALMAAMGGNSTPDNETDAAINFTGLVEGGMMPYTNSMGIFAWFILLVIPFTMLWIVQGKAWIPLVLGLMVAGTALMLGYIPAEYATPVMAFIGLSIAAIVYSLYKNRGA